jgi:hypothetical protein
MRRALLAIICLIPLAACMRQAPEARLVHADRLVPRQGLPDPAPARMLLVIAAILAAALLASCTLFRPTSSWVELAEDADAGPLSEAITAFVAEAVPERGAVIALAAPPEEQGGNLITLQLGEKLTARGYRLAGADDIGGRHLRYLVSRYGEGVLLRVTLDGAEISVIFARDAGGVLKAAAPLAMRQKAEMRP